MVLLGRVPSVVCSQLSTWSKSAVPQFFPWIPSGSLLNVWFLGRVKILCVSSALYGEAAACFQGSRSWKNLQKNLLKELWPTELDLGKQEMAAGFQGAVFAFSVEEKWKYKVCQLSSSLAEKTPRARTMCEEVNTPKNKMAEDNRTLKNSKRSNFFCKPLPAGRWRYHESFRLTCALPGCAYLCNPCYEQRNCWKCSPWSFSPFCLQVLEEDGLCFNGGICFCC